MATIKWLAPEAVTSALFLQLNSLVDSTSATTGFSEASAEIPNETDLFQYIALEFICATQGSARASGAFVAVYLVGALDGTNFAAGSDTTYGVQLTAFGLDAATTARRLVRVNLPIPPIDFQLQLFNDTGQALASGANALNYRRYNEQVS